MGSNIEIKARIDSAETMCQRLVDLGVPLSGVLLQTDTFFHCAQGRLKLREFEQGVAELIAYDRSDQALLRQSTYERVEVSDAAGLKRSLTSAMGVRGVVEKRRDLYLVETTRIHVDQVQGLGDFMEIEVVLRDGVDAQAGQRIGELWLDRLGVQPADLLAEAYIDLLER